MVRHPQHGRRDALKKSYLVKLGLLESKYPMLLSADKISALVREFFGQYFHIGYEFTFEELVRELRARHVSPAVMSLIEGLASKVSEAKFDPDSGTGADDLLLLAAQAKFVISKV